MKKHFKKTDNQSLNIREIQRMVSTLTEQAKSDLFMSLKKISDNGGTNFFEQLSLLADEIPKKYDLRVESIMEEYACHYDIINEYEDNKKPTIIKLPNEVKSLKKIHSDYYEFFSWFQFVANDLEYIYDQLKTSNG